ncbi:MAG: hypothetical protein U0M12_08315 [Acutalibacteraceae bacterium]|nr:hypothetical protein [Acutalibacteraceae bacterium]
MRRYSEDMDKMQQEAVRRMQEMQSRGKPSATPVHEQKQPSVQPQPEVIEHNEENCITGVTPNKKQNSVFDSLFLDKERSLILLLLLLLSTEKTDMGLILALVYLLI